MCNDNVSDFGFIVSGIGMFIWINKADLIYPLFKLQLLTHWVQFLGRGLTVNKKSTRRSKAFLIYSSK